MRKIHAYTQLGLIAIIAFCSVVSTLAFPLVCGNCAAVQSGSPHEDDERIPKAVLIAADLPGRLHRRNLSPKMRAIMERLEKFYEGEGYVADANE